MTGVMILSLAAAAWWGVSLVVFLASIVGALAPRRARLSGSARTTPPLSALLPVKLVNPGFERAQASIFHQDYPDYEVLVAAAERESPALTTMAGLARGASAPTRIMHSPAIGAVSPKLNTLTAPLAIARDLVFTKDSNVTLAPDTLRDFVGALDADVGLVCGVPVAARPETFAGVIEAILINRDARLLLAAGALGKGFGVGKAMLFRRRDLERVGGVAALAYTIAEDSALSKALAGIGLKTVFARAPITQEIGARSLADVYGRQARWAVIRRAEEPATFPLEPLACPLPAAIAGALAAPLLGLAPAHAFVATLVGWAGLELATTALKRWEISPWFPLAFIGRDLVILAAWIMAWTTREVVWAGGRQDVRDTLRRPRPNETP